jgi:hypothetical protein
LVGELREEVVVVHGGQVVVDQRVRVDHLHRAGRRHDVVHAAADRLGPGNDEDRAQTLAPGEDAVAHGLVQRLGRRRLFGQEAPERLVHGARPLRHVGPEVEARLFVFHP